jgi:3'-5' exoribonuclease
VTVRAVVEEYRGQRQLVIERLKAAEQEEMDAADLVPKSSHDLDTLRGRLLEIVESVSNPHLKALLEQFFCDEEFVGCFCRAAGAKSLHHSHLGGLVEHTVGVLEILETVARVHPELDRDLMMAGALLHDLGKVTELECSTSIDYTDAGRLVGHTVLTDRMVNRAIERIEGFPEELANRLTHLLLSHHGQREYGAPVLPMTAEACALHYADNLDAHVQYFGQVIADGQASGSRWSDYQRLFERYIYVGSHADAPGGQLPSNPPQQAEPNGPEAVPGEAPKEPPASTGSLFD